MVLINVAVTKVHVPLFNRAAAYRACQGKAVFGKHYIYMAFTSKIGA